jgi:hypothetical protein
MIVRVGGAAVIVAVVVGVRHAGAGAHTDCPHAGCASPGRAIVGAFSTGAAHARVLIGSISNSCAAGSTETSTYDRAYRTANGSACKATGHRATSATHGSTTFVCVSCVIAPASLRGSAARVTAHVATFIRSVAGCCAASCAETSADYRAHRTANDSTCEATGHRATGAANGSTALICVSCVVAATSLSGGIVRVVYAVGCIFGGITCALTQGTTYRATNRATNAHTYGTPDSAQCSTGSRASATTTDCAYFISGIIALGRAGYSSACCSTYSSAQANSEGACDRCADSRACCRATQSTGCLSTHSVVVIATISTRARCRRAIAIVGVGIEAFGIAANVTCANTVEHVTGRAFLAVGHAGGH